MSSRRSATFVTAAVAAVGLTVGAAPVLGAPNLPSLPSVPQAPRRPRAAQAFPCPSQPRRPRRAGAQRAAGSLGPAGPRHRPRRPSPRRPRSPRPGRDVRRVRRQRRWRRRSAAPAPGSTGSGAGVRRLPGRSRHAGCVPPPRHRVGALGCRHRQSRATACGARCAAERMPRLASELPAPRARAPRGRARGRPQLAYAGRPPPGRRPAHRSPRGVARPREPAPHGTRRLRRLIGIPGVRPASRPSCRWASCETMPTLTTAGLASQRRPRRSERAAPGRRARLHRVQRGHVLGLRLGPQDRRRARRGRRCEARGGRDLAGRPDAPAGASRAAAAACRRRGLRDPRAGTPRHGERARGRAEHRDGRGGACRGGAAPAAPRRRPRRPPRSRTPPPPWLPDDVFAEPAPEEPEPEPSGGARAPAASPRLKLRMRSRPRRPPRRRRRGQRHRHPAPPLGRARGPDRRRLGGREPRGSPGVALAPRALENFGPVLLGIGPRAVEPARGESEQRAGDGDQRLDQLGVVAARDREARDHDSRTRPRPRSRLGTPPRSRPRSDRARRP